MSIPSRPSFSAHFRPIGRPLLALWSVLRGWGRLLATSAMLLVLLASRTAWQTHKRGELAQEVVRAAWSLLPRFTVGVLLSALLILPLLRSALLPLGLGPLGSEILVRFFLAQILPWACAFALLLEYVLPQCAMLCRRARRSKYQGESTGPSHPIRFMAAQPILLASLLGMGLLFIGNALLLLAVDYGVSHGFHPWALGDHAALIGNIFTPTFSLILVLKMLLFSSCAVVLPLAVYVAEFTPDQHNSDVQLRILVRVVLSLALVDVLALLAWYA